MSKPKQALVDENVVEEQETNDGERILYDAREPQAIPLNLPPRTRVVHNLGPLTDARFFQFQEEQEKAIRLKRTATGIYEPKIALWRDLVLSREGYKESPNWKQTAKPEHCIAAINALATVRVLNEDDTATNGDGLFDEFGSTVIQFQVMQSGVLLTLSHTFKAESKADTDEFVSITTGTDSPNALASAQQVSKAERLCKIGRRLLLDSEGYAPGCEVPAVHLAETVGYFLIMQSAVMGKGLAV